MARFLLRIAVNCLIGSDKYSIEISSKIIGYNTIVERL